MKTSATSMATRLAAAVILVSLVSLVVATWVGLTTGRDLGEDLFVERLESLQTSAAFDTTATMTSLDRAATAAAESPQAAVATELFAEAFDELADELGTDRTDYDDEITLLFDAYVPRYIEPQDGTGRTPTFREILAETPAGVRLQSTYSIPMAGIRAEAIDDALDGSSWSEVHQVMHPVYRDIVQRVGYVDLLLVDAANRTVVYSVKKNPDLGTSLETGPFSGTGLALSVDRVLNNPEAGTFTSDLGFYPTSLEPLGVIASPIMSDGKLLGVLAAMYDSTPLTSILTADGEWETAGYPETSDTYLGGFDDTTRSEPRGYVEDPELFLDQAEAAGGLTEDERLAIETRGTTVLTLRVDDSTVVANRDSTAEIAERKSITGADVFSTIGPLDESAGDDALPWLVVAEIDTSVANSDIDDFRELLIVGVAIFVAVLAFAAAYWAGGIVRPVRQISDRLVDARALGDRALDHEPEPLDVPDRSPIEFHRLAHSFETMAASLRAQRASVAAARAERLGLLRRMLPPTVAQRIADGHVQALEEVPQVTVGVAVVEGMGALVQVGAEAASRDVVDRLLSELDELAEQHGVERVKLVGDAYFAACGHDRPYLDHAPRLVGFVSDARDAVREISTESGTNVGLDLTAGIHTGAVTVGMTGGARLVYDVWGGTVTVAHEIARRADHGEILVTESTKRLLPDTVEVEHSTSNGDESVWSVEPATVKGPA